MKTCNRLARCVAPPGISKTNLISLTMSEDLMRKGIMDMTDHIEGVDIFMPEDCKKEMTKGKGEQGEEVCAYTDEKVYVAVNTYTGLMHVTNKTDEELTIYFDVCLGNHNRRQ